MGHNMGAITGPLSLLGGIGATAMGQPELGIPLISSGLGGTIGQMAGGNTGAAIGSGAGGALGLGADMFAPSMGTGLESILGKAGGALKGLVGGMAPAPATPAAGATQQTAQSGFSDPLSMHKGANSLLLSALGLAPDLMGAIGGGNTPPPAPPSASEFPPSRMPRGLATASLPGPNPPVRSAGMMAGSLPPAAITGGESMPYSGPPAMSPQAQASAAYQAPQSPLASVLPALVARALGLGGAAGLGYGGAGSALGYGGGAPMLTGPAAPLQIPFEANPFGLPPIIE